MVRKKKTTSISELGHEFVTRIDPGGKRYESKAVELWPSVAGEEIDRHTRGIAVREGELIVYVDSPGWANELSLMAEYLRGRLNSAAGQDLVTSIRFSVSRQVSRMRHEQAVVNTEEEYYAADQTPAAALSEQELQQAQYVAAAIEDPELREKALRVMIKDLERKKGARIAKRSQRGTDGARDNSLDS